MKKQQVKEAYLAAMKQAREACKAAAEEVKDAD